MIIAPTYAHLAKTPITVVTVAKKLAGLNSPAVEQPQHDRLQRQEEGEEDELLLR